MTEQTCAGGYGGGAGNGNSASGTQGMILIELVA